MNENSQYLLTIAQSNARVYSADLHIRAVIIERMRSAPENLAASLAHEISQ